MKKLFTAKLLISWTTATSMLTLSPFGIVSHLKSDLRTYIKYLDT